MPWRCPGGHKCRARTVALLLHKQGCADAGVLTRSRRKRCIQPVYACAAACGVALVYSAVRRAVVGARRKLRRTQPEDFIMNTAHTLIIRHCAIS